ncbi:six-Cys-in-45 modification radical SAM protein [Pseudoramibacter alactolyticus ATCC 23263]|uniref:Six-Cys-in-45 modification radical SAM protein n=1 Tax=Pseudoramibacter alactolyticus ATCC 23263 TaxID=887929 RepID=E6ME04_9FIRM|nr:thioether cross-link-forming SCIFF peptide maturase [Pseudoramibacter alactolyticus]EFV02763.1 six-Cys-in-45 modification radical SAM protein [Pseudoramibacter alactolyticus ATCC 23263]
MIHKFYLNGYYIVLDVASGTLLSVDRMTYDILDDYKLADKAAIVAKWQNRYDLNELAEAVDEIAELEAGGMLYAKDDYDPMVYQNYNLIKSMCLNVAHDCNLRCAYCFASQGDFNGDRDLMPLEVGKKAFDFLVAQSKNRHNLEVDFFGGEPLMNFRVVKDLVAYGRSLEKEYNKRFNFTMTTNAVLLNDENMRWIDDNMNNVVLSLDGRKAVNDHMRKTVSGGGSFDVIIENIKKMAALREASGKEYYVRGTYTKNNLDFGKDVEFLAKQGFRSVSVEPVVTDETKNYAILEGDVDRIKAEYDRLALAYLDKEAKGLDYLFYHFMVNLDAGPCVYKRISGCGAGRDYVAVTPQGTIYPCHQFVGNDDFIMGNVDEGITNPQIKETFMGANLLKKEACRECWCRYFCGGGCHANAWNFNHTVMEPYDVSCEIEKRRVENALMIKIVQDERATAESEMIAGVKEA